MAYTTVPGPDAPEESLVQILIGSLSNLVSNAQHRVLRISSSIRALRLRSETLPAIARMTTDIKTGIKVLYDQGLMRTTQSCVHWLYQRATKRRTLPLAIILCLLALLISCGISMGAYGATQRFQCDPNGNLWVAPYDDRWYFKRNIWATEYLLAITVGWGGLNFAAAKGTDVAWDLVVGRGWQAMAAWVVYTVYRSYWVVNLKKTDRGLPVQVTMALEYNTASLSGLRTYARTILSRSSTSWEYRSSTAILVLCVLHVLLAPTWLSAMTGYMPLSTPLVKLEDGTFIEPTRMKSCTVILRDGKRIGMKNNLCITDSGTENDPWSLPGLEKYYDDYFTDNEGSYMDFRYLLQGEGSNRTNIKSNFTALHKTYNLDPPLLHLHEADGWVLGYDDKLYTLSDIVDSGVCEPKNKYQWGFSYQLTFGFLLTTNVLALALYFVWLASDSDEDRELADTIFGSLRTAYVVSEAMAETVGDDIATMSNDELVARTSGQRSGIAFARHRETYKLEPVLAESEPSLAESEPPPAESEPLTWPTRAEWRRAILRNTIV